MSQQYERIKAFSGVLFALAQVQIFARNENADIDALTHSLSTLLVTDPESISDVYPETFMLQTGYRLILKQLEDKGQKDIELTRYLVGILSLERKLSRSANLSEMAKRIDDLKRKLIHFKITDEQVVSNISSIYTDLISNLGPKIMISGAPEVLKRPNTQHKVRALLLSAIRSAILWRQLGGKRRDLIFSRKAIIQAAKHNLKQ